MMDGYKQMYGRVFSSTWILNVTAFLSISPRFLAFPQVSFNSNKLYCTTQLRRAQTRAQVYKMLK